jgi:hypothetical protein
MISAVTIIKDILVEKGVGTFNATGSIGTITIGKMPATPDACVVVSPSGGGSPDPKWRLDYPSVQVRVRGPKNDYVSAETKAKQVRAALLGLFSRIIPGGKLYSVTMPGDYTFLGWDDNLRPEFSLNFRLILELDEVDNREPLALY